MEAEEKTKKRRPLWHWLIAALILSILTIIVLALLGPYFGETMCMGPYIDFEPAWVPCDP